MNLRTHKRMRLLQQRFIVINGYWQRVIDKALDAAMMLTPAEKEAEKIRNEKLWSDLWGSLDKNMAKRQLVEEGFRGPDEPLEHEVKMPALPTGNPMEDIVAAVKKLDADAAVKDEFLGTAPRYTVAKKSTGEIVATDLDLGAAEAMIQKAKTGKKAALVIA